MSAPSPTQVESTQVTYTVTIDGQPLDDAVSVVSIDTWSAVGKVPRARLEIYDGSASESDFPLSNQRTFLPGNRVEVAVGYMGKREDKIFAGVIVKQGIEIQRNQASRLIVDLVDEAIEMTLERRNGIFENLTDSDLIGQLITRNGLQKQVSSTQTVHEDIVQYYATDWDLMLTRAEMNSFVVLVDSGTVTVEKPDTRQEPVLEVEYGDSILDLKARMDAATQLSPSAIKSYSWDVASQKRIEAGPGAVDVQEPGNVSSAELARVFAVEDYNQQTGGTIEKSSLQEWSSAELLKSKLSKIRGDVRFQGNARARIGKTLALAGLGNRFNGTAYVSGVHHKIKDGRWLTTAEFGLSSRWFAAEADDITAPEASGLLPPIQGLQTGVVKSVARDPEGEFRVELTLPLLLDDSKSVWARLGGPYASGGAGQVFYPETGDEVIVAFMNQDPRYPVILGSVYSQKHVPPYPPEEANDKKAIVTRSQLEITFDDADQVIEINTPGGHSIRLDDAQGQISIADSNRNSAVFSSSGITLDSAGGVTIKARRDITLDAGANLSLSAKANATMEGLQVSHQAKTKFSAKGNATAELIASGILTVRGAIVKIN